MTKIQVFEKSNEPGHGERLTFDFFSVGFEFHSDSSLLLCKKFQWLTIFHALVRTAMNFSRVRISTREEHGYVWAGIQIDIYACWMTRQREKFFTHHFSGPAERERPGKNVQYLIALQSGILCCRKNATFFLSSLSRLIKLQVRDSPNRVNSCCYQLRLLTIERETWVQPGMNKEWFFERKRFLSGQSEVLCALFSLCVSGKLLK